jgi:hypothetical protein
MITLLSDSIMLSWKISSDMDGRVKGKEGHFKERDMI